MVERLNDRGQVTQAALAVEKAEELERELGDPAIQDGHERSVTLALRQRLAGEELAEAGVGPGELEERLEFVQDLLGLLLAAQLTLLTRGSVMRKHPVTLAVLSIMAAIVAHAVVVAIISLRGLYDGVEGWRPAAEIGSRMISALFTGGAALVMAFLLNLVEPMFGFQSDRSRRRY